MQTWPLQRECDTFYGNPRGTNGRANPGWEATNLILVPCPWKLSFAGQPVRGLRVHKKCAESMKRVLDAIWVRFGRSQAAIESARMHLYAGAYNYRLMRGGNSLSMHSYGCAVDFDPERNGLGDSTPAMDRRVIEEFEREGWEWGGHWSRCDGMHFQAARTQAVPKRLAKTPTTVTPVETGAKPVLTAFRAADHELHPGVVTALAKEKTPVTSLPSVVSAGVVPWYQKKTVISGILAFALPAVGFATGKTINIDPDTTAETIVKGVELAGSIAGLAAAYFGTTTTRVTQTAAAKIEARSEAAGG